MTPTAFSANLARRIKRMLLQWESFRADGPGVSWHKGPDSASLHIEPALTGGGAKYALARITAESSTAGYYQLVEVDGQGVDLTNGRTWDTNPDNQPEARELNATAEIPTDTIVLLERATDSNGDLVWVFDGPGGGDTLPDGGGLYQHLTIVGTSPRTLGWDHARAHN